MTSANSLLAERLAFLAIIASSATGATVATGQILSSSYVSIAGTNANLFGRIAGLAFVSATSNTGAITVSLIKASDTNGSNAATVVNATAVASGAANIPLMVELNLNGAAGAFSDTTNVYYAVRITNAGAGGVHAALVGVDPKYGPASTYNIAATNTGSI